MNDIITIIEGEKFILNPWKEYGKYNYKWNFYRSTDYTVIGFCIWDSKFFIKNPDLAIWTITCGSFTKLTIIVDLFKKMYGEKIIGIENLEVAKNNLDNLLIKYDKLNIYS